MLRELRQADETETETERSTERRRMLGRGLPFAAAFLAGFLFGRRSGDGETLPAPETVQSERGETRPPTPEPDAHGGGTQEAGMATVETETDTQAVQETGAEGVEEFEDTDAEPEGDVAAEAEAVGEIEETEETESGDLDEPATEDAESDEAEREAEAETDESEREDASEADEDEAAESEAEIADEVAAVTAPTARGMPMFGLGTYQMDDYDDCVEAVTTAIEAGYRHIDTAEGYHNEEAVGDAIAEADVDREELFVATKIGPENLDYDQVLTTAEESLERLGLDYVDLLYVHWPTGEYEATDTLDAFAELRREGLTEEIGVSNFTVELLEEAIEVSDEPVFANQVEMHPLLRQDELQEFCESDDADVELVAYSPIARGEVDDVDELQEIADDHDATPAQVSLAWLREKGVTAIPKAASADHIRENWLSLAVELDDEEVERIDAIDREERVVDPDQAPWN